MTAAKSEQFADPDGGGSVRRYLCLDRSEVVDPVGGGWLLQGTAPIAPHLRDGSGLLRTGALLAMIDSVGGFASGLAALPAWIVTTSLMLRVGNAPLGDSVRLEPRVLRRGKNSVVTEISVFDDPEAHADPDDGPGGDAVASAVITCAVLSPEAGPPRLERPVHLPAPPPYEAAEQWDAFFGIADGEGATTTVMQLRPHLRNRWGILHGGAVAALIDVAALRVAGPGLSTDVVLHFLSPARTGPVEAVAEVIGHRADGTLVQVAVRDLGNDSRKVATASVTVRPV